MVAIVHHERDALMSLSVAAAANGLAVTASEACRPIDRAMTALGYGPTALLVARRAHEDPTPLAERCAQLGVGLLLLEPDGAEAPRAGCAQLSSDTSTAVVMATLLTLIARRSVARAR
jgi:hypothetical protein